MTDTITLLSHQNAPMCKTWKKDGTIAPYASAKYFKMKEFEIRNIQHLSRLLKKIEKKQSICMIRGKYIGDEEASVIDHEFKPGYVRRTNKVFKDQPLHTILIEVDDFRPSNGDPVLNPEECVEDFIEQCLPTPFHYVSCHWQLSNSAGHPRNQDVFKVHIWFWLATPFTSSQAKQWAKTNCIKCDTAVLQTVQIHYTASPRFEEGVSDPVLRRSGLIEGLVSDEVALPQIMLETDHDKIQPDKELDLTKKAFKEGTRYITADYTDQIAETLYKQGLVKNLRSDGGLNITCPCSNEHTTDSSESSTVYYPPNTGGYRRWAIICFHSHCKDRPRLNFLKSLGVSSIDLMTKDMDNLNNLLSCSSTTHVSNLKRLYDLFADKIFYCNGQWYMWTGTHWKRDNNIIYSYAQAVAHVVHDEASDLQRRGPEGKSAVEHEKKVNLLFNWARKSEMTPNIDALVKLAKHHFAISTDQLDQCPDSLNFENGTVDLKIGKVRPHNPKDYITRCLRAKYELTEAPLFLDTMKKIAGEYGKSETPLTNFFIRWFGYCATGHVSEQKLVVHYGTGSNGKSTLLDTVAWVFGEYASTAPPGLLIAGPDKHPTEIADICGRRMVTAHESGDGKSLKEDFIKQATGGDKLKARRMRQDFFEFDPTHKLQLVTNYKPRIQGQDHGIWRRIMLVPYRTMFGSKEEVAQGHARYEKDINLIEKLREERAGILALIVRGAVEWYKSGLNPPDLVLEASIEYKSEQDKIAQFVAECCEVGSNYEIVFSGEPGSIYDRYGSWCRESGYRPLAKNRFSQELYRVVPGISRKNDKVRTPNGRKDIVKFLGIRTIGDLL